MEDQSGIIDVEGNDAPQSVCEPRKITVTLHQIDSTHVEVIRAWRNDYRIYKWCRQDDFITDVGQRNWYEKQRTDPHIRMWLVALDATDPDTNKIRKRAVGVCGLTSIDMISRRAEFSLYIDPDLHKMGLGKAAMHCLFQKGFDDLNLNMIWGESFDGNPAISLFKKFGMKHEGVRRNFYFKEGEYLGAHLFSMTKKEWKRRQQPESEYHC